MNTPKLKQGVTQDTGYVWAPYIPVTTATYINSEMVWHRNKWINFWLKIKRIFKKPTYIPNKLIKSCYSTKTINPEFFGIVTVNELTR